MEAGTQRPERLVVLTGGPGSGKTTLIEALAAKGFTTRGETGRAIIREQQRIGGCGLPWVDPLLFADLMLSRDIAQYEAIAGAAVESGSRATVFFDRGVVDVAGYLALVGGTIPDHVASASRLFRYHREVFILPPWPEIFANDTERKQDFGEAVRTFEALSRTYAKAGYRLVEVPKASVEERVAFLLGRLSPV